MRARSQRRKSGNGTEDLVRQYLNELGGYALLTPEDEVELARAIELGNLADAALADGGVADVTRRELERRSAAGADARRRFIQSNLRLVVSIAKRYQSSGL